MLAEFQTFPASPDLRSPKNPARTRDPGRRGWRSGGVVSSRRLAHGELLWAYEPSRGSQHFPMRVYCVNESCLGILERTGS